MATPLQLDARSALARDLVAASIAHEVSQPLTAIIVNAATGFRCLDHSPPDVDRAKDAFKRIVADGHRAAAVVEDIRADFRRDPGQSDAIDVNELIEGVIALQRGEIGQHRVRVCLETDWRLPKVHGNRGQLQQVLLNLTTNAIDALAQQDGPRVLSVRSAAQGSEHILVSVGDSGRGVEPSAAARVFEPRFTTKPRGMGMGLAICRSIVQGHDGKLWFVPNAPTGAVFHFTVRIAASPTQTKV